MNGVRGDAMSVLTEDELVELIDLVARWKVAQWNGDFLNSDALRAQLMAWGAWPPEHGWHPVFETTEHRYARRLARESTIN